MGDKLGHWKKPVKKVFSLKIFITPEGTLSPVSLLQIK